MSKSNEGKACDAVIRRIETREGSSRHDLRLPEKEGDAAPIEVACRIGERLFAFEHTRIEPFEGHIRLQADGPHHFRPVEERVAGIVAPDTLLLVVPAKATQPLNRRQIETMQQALGDWIIQEAPTLPRAPYRSYRRPLKLVADLKVPFDVSAYRLESPVPTEGGRLFVEHMFGGNLECERLARLRRAYDKKNAQLMPWRRKGARGVLILEEDDRDLTNHEFIADALLLIEQGKMERPDEIYLLSTIVKTPWSLWALRVDDYVYDNFSVWGESLSQIDPATLDDLTGR